MTSSKQCMFLKSKASLKHKEPRFPNQLNNLQSMETEMNGTRNHIIRCNRAITFNQMIDSTYYITFSYTTIHYDVSQGEGVIRKF